MRALSVGGFMSSIIRKLTQVRLAASTSKGAAAAKGAAAPALIGPPPTAPANVFVTPQTLVTFPVASAVVFGGWQLAVRLGWHIGSSPYAVPIALAFLWGLYLFYLDVTDPSRKGELTANEKVTKAVVALVNALFLAMSALGVDTVSKASAQTPPTSAAASAGAARATLIRPAGYGFEWEKLRISEGSGASSAHGISPGRCGSLRADLPLAGVDEAVSENLKERPKSTFRWLPTGTDMGLARRSEPVLTCLFS